MWWKTVALSDSCVALIMLGIEELSSKNWQKVGDEGSDSEMIRSERGWGTFSQYFSVKFSR